MTANGNIIAQLAEILQATRGVKQNIASKQQKGHHSIPVNGLTKSQAMRAILSRRFVWSQMSSKTSIPESLKPYKLF